MHRQRVSLRPVLPPDLLGLSRQLHPQVQRDPANPPPQRVLPALLHRWVQVDPSDRLRLPRPGCLGVLAIPEARAVP